ncbi:MAG: ATP-dependent helicase HepA [Halioglobus sp.]|jgi:ATP-dependent helicase HepA
MFRNTRRAISGFPERELNIYDLDDDSLDSKALWLMQFLADKYPAKVLVICSAMESIQAISEVLRVAGVQSAQFHENMSIVERDRAAAWFADTEEDCRLMLCSEIGSEGRNFQFLHDLVLLELPDSPDLLEQRIGRVDRIGQTQTIQIHVPVASDSRDAILLNWYHKGLNAFERICKSGTAVRTTLADPLTAVLEQAPHADAAAVDSLIELTSATTIKLDTELEAGRDRLLELNSNRPEQVQEHLDELSRLDRNYALQDFMDAVFDRFGIDVTEQRDHWIIHPSDHMQVENFPHLPASGMTLTFDRNTALTREDFTFLTWDHPMVTDSMDLILDESFGQADCQVIKAEELPKTLSFVEASYVLQCTADPSLNIERYLPSQVQTYAIGIDGTDYTEVVAGIELDSRKQRYDRNALRKVIVKNREALERLMDKATAMAEQTMPGMLDEARDLLEQEYTDARERLVSLARVNPSVKDDEIDALDTKKTAMLEALSGTHARPVSVRVMFNS